MNTFHCPRALLHFAAYTVSLSQNACFTLPSCTNSPPSRFIQEHQRSDNTALTHHRTCQLSRLGIQTASRSSPLLWVPVPQFFCDFHLCCPLLSSIRSFSLYGISPSSIAICPISHLLLADLPWGIAPFLCPIQSEEGFLIMLVIGTLSAFSPSTSSIWAHGNYIPQKFFMSRSREITTLIHLLAALVTTGHSPS